MEVKAKDTHKTPFIDINVGTVFRDDGELYMRVFMEDDYIVCPRCNEDIYAGKELGGVAVHLITGDVHKFDDWDYFEVVNGKFIEE
jgi:hypothetical protein